MASDFHQTMTILVVDDERPIRDLIRRIVTSNGYKCYQAANGEDALEILAEKNVDVVVTDLSMPGINGIELTDRIKRYYDADVIMMTGYFKNLNFMDAIAFGAKDFIKKPFDSEELNIRLQRVISERATRAELKESLLQVEKTVDGVVDSLSFTVEARDPYTAGHQKQVAEIAVSIAKHLHLSELRIKGIYMASLIHDLGKIAIPAEILSKPGKLSNVEFELIKTHSAVGYSIIKDINFKIPIADIIHQHHERNNGKGYPQGLKEDQILLEAKIIAVADVVEAMSSHRPYRPALGMDRAIEEITTNKGVVYDEIVVGACLEVLELQTRAES